jgi:V/A-type H+-transporting ATPase subunit D
MNLRHPPGRAGRLWLLDRLAVAERAAGILDRKQHALLHDHERLTALTEQTSTTWTAVVRDAETWQRRAMILGARPDLQAAATQIPPAQARIVWRTEMGVEVPSEASSEPAQPPSLPGAPALAAAATAYRRAMQAAVEHAAATTALRRVDSELALTLRRLRAIRDRWVPQLQETLRDLELQLDEHEREELTRTRLHDRTRSALTPLASGGS